MPLIELDAASFIIYSGHRVVTITDAAFNQVNMYGGYTIPYYVRSYAAILYHVTAIS